MNIVVNEVIEVSRSMIVVADEVREVNRVVSEVVQLMIVIINAPIEVDQAVI